MGVKSEPTVGLAVRIKTIISEDWVDFLREFINLVQSSFLASNILDFFTRFVTPIVKEKLKICLNNSVFSYECFLRKLRTGLGLKKARRPGRA